MSKTAFQLKDCADILRDSIQLDPDSNEKYILGLRI
jgi:hypothetical protein